MSMESVSLPQVAGLARCREVRFIVQASARGWNDVVDMEDHTVVGGARSAVAASKSVAV
jgi:transketolase C-terminal domain/subunit